MLSCGRPSPRYVEVEDNPDGGRCCGLPVLSSMGGEGTLNAAASRFGGAGGVRNTIRRGGGGPSRDTICEGGGKLMGSPNPSRGIGDPMSGGTPNPVLISSPMVQLVETFAAFCKAQGAANREKLLANEAKTDAQVYTDSDFNVLCIDGKLKQ
ncbi:hypothetical protein U9M48_002234 [Paspalum notatum var. saurae]|uniref:Uncharacterized protein n=1 Tax=Paspalum notatum var. saurae TaxID=547442 RepID=A0AAQ3PGW0_PASNO